LVPSHIQIYGFIYDVKNGKLTPISKIWILFDYV
jgi:hypothetical protein